MSPVLPREERDAIRAAHDRGCRWCETRGDGPKCSTGRLLDALDAAEEAARWQATEAAEQHRLRVAAEAENERLRPLARRGSECFEQCHETRLGMVPPPFVTEPQTMDEARQKIGGLRGALSTALADRDAARAEVAALREAHVSAADIARASERSLEYHEGFAAGVAALAQAQDAALRALAADEGEREAAVRYQEATTPNAGDLSAARQYLDTVRRLDPAMGPLCDEIEGERTGR